MQPKNIPAGGQWAEQQKIAAEKQKKQPSKGARPMEKNSNKQEGGSGKPQSTPLEPEKQGGIGGP
jgi:hypothetical protein